MAAFSEFVEVGEAGIGLLGPAARGPPDLAGNVVKPTGSLTSGRACRAASILSRQHAAFTAMIPTISVPTEDELAEAQNRMSALVPETDEEREQGHGL